jgi:hypothetical protein
MRRLRNDREMNGDEPIAQRLADAEGGADERRGDAGLRAALMRVCGVDFTSRPGPRKPIVVAVATLRGRQLSVQAIERLTDFPSFESWLATPGPWVGGFDFPFGLPRRFVEAHTPARDWESLVSWAAALGREGFCAVAHPAFRAARGRPQDKHRAVDALARSHSPLKTMDPMRRQAINPPVGLMFFEGAPRLARAGVDVPGLRENGDRRVAVEAYPGAVAAELGLRHYKNDRPESAASRRAARRSILQALADGAPLDIVAAVPRPLARRCLDDAGGDALDSVICAAQAAWCAVRAARRYGLPPQVDPVEGWIAAVRR